MHLGVRRSEELFLSREGLGSMMVNGCGSSEVVMVQGRGFQAQDLEVLGKDAESA